MDAHVKQQYAKKNVNHCSNLSTQLNIGIGECVCFANAKTHRPHPQ